MRRSPLPLTLALLALAALLLLPGTRRAAGGPAAYRQVLVWGLPIAAGLLSAAIAPRRAPAPETRGSFGAAIRLAPYCLLAFLADYAFLAIGHSSGWLTFTFGDLPLYGHPILTACWALPACLLAGALGWEMALRGRLLPAWGRFLPAGAAAGLSAAVGLALAVPVILDGASVRDLPFTAAALASAACREIGYCLLVLSGGGVLAAGLLRGLLLYVDAFLVNDWFSPYFPAANFTSSDPILYLVRGGSSLAALALIVLGARRAVRRPEPAP